MLSPSTRELYAYLAKEHPDIYEAVRDIDTSLAELHMAGLELQRQRRAFFDIAMARLGWSATKIMTNLGGEPS